MPNSIEITKQFPASRERTVLLQLLTCVRKFQELGIELILCGGWVPFLKELSAASHSGHRMSLDIDVLLTPESRDERSVDEINRVLRGPLGFAPDLQNRFRFEKNVDDNLVQLDLLTNEPHGNDDIVLLYGRQSTLSVAVVNGGEVLEKHTEQIEIYYMENGIPSFIKLRIPDSTAFLTMKSHVSYRREDSKDPYDVYYYCKHIETPEKIREKLKASLDELIVRSSMVRLRQIFSSADSKWVEMVLDHLLIFDSMAREREGAQIVASVLQVLPDLGGPET